MSFEDERTAKTSADILVFSINFLVIGNENNITLFL